MLDPNWCHFLCFPAVCHRTWNCRPYASNIWSRTPEVQCNVRGLKADKSRHLSTAEISDLRSLGVDTDFILSSHPQSTQMEYISCVSTGSVNCLFTDCDQWYSWMFSCPDVTVQPVNYEEWGGDADTTSGSCRHRRQLPDTRKSTKATSVQSYWNVTS